MNVSTYLYRDRDRDRRRALTLHSSSEDIVLGFAYKQSPYERITMQREVYKLPRSDNHTHTGDYHTLYSIHVKDRVYNYK